MFQGLLALRQVAGDLTKYGRKVKFIMFQKSFWSLAGLLWGLNLVAIAHANESYLI